MREDEPKPEKNISIGGIEKSPDSQKPYKDQIQDILQQADPEKVQKDLKVRRVSALLSPDAKDSFLIHARIKEQIFEGQDTREKGVETKGFNSSHLKDKGNAIEKKYQDYLRESQSQGQFLPQDQKIEGSRAEGLACSDVESKGGVKRIEHSSLSVGLAAELSRQMRKIVSAYGNDAARRTEVLGQDDVELTPEDVRRFTGLCTPKNPSYKTGMKEILDLVGQPEKKKQYTTAIRMLNLELQSGK